jgi:ATP-dependent Clp protease ATP-binding subunit ClpA
MRRAIQRLIQDPLALKLITGEFGDGDTILVKTKGSPVDTKGDEGELQFEKLVPLAA